MKRQFLKALLLSTALVPIAWGRAVQDDVLVLRVGKILTVTKGVINGGVIIIKEGRIAAIGPEGEVAIPEGARVIDARDRWATPGLIDLHCHIGGMMGDINDMVNPTNPEMSTRPTIDPQNDNLKDAVAGGVTTVLYIPGSGTNLGGFGTLMQTAGGKTADDLIVRWPGGMKVAQAWNPERRSGDLGASRMGMWWGLRHLLDRAKNYNDAMTAFEKGQTKLKPEAQPDLELMRGLFQHKYPVIIHTADARDVMGTVRMFHDEYNLKMIVSHGEFGGFKVAEEIAKRGLPANIGPRLYDFDALAGHVPDGHCNGIPTKYAEGGVKRLSLCTDSPVVPQEDLVFQGTMAIHLGLDPEVALRALTIEPADAVLIADRKGSIEVGKDADIVLWSGDLFDVRNYVVLVTIRGKVVYDISKDRRRY